MSKKINAVLLTFVLLLMFVFVGCSTAWVNTLDSILQAAAPALINILQIVAIAEGKPFNTTLAGKVNGDAATIKSLANDLASASTTAAPTVCSQLTAAIQTYSMDQAQVLQLAQVNDKNTQTKIAILSGLVAGTVQAVLAVVPNCQAPPAKLKTMRVTPPLQLSTFIKDYNAVLVTPTGNAVVDQATPKMKLHQHNRLVRFLSLGRLQ